jgi:hypothetical protein
MSGGCLLRCFLLPLAIAFALLSCAPNPELARRSANDPPLPAGRTEPVLSVSSIAASDSDDSAKKDDSAKSPAAPAASPGVRITLSDPKASDLADIKKVLDKAPKQPAPDLTALKRTLVLTIAKGAYRPADRLVNLTITIRPTNFIISDVKNFKTDYGSVDIAHLDLSQTNSVTASISPTLPGALGTGQLGYTAGNTLDEQAQLSVRPEIQNINMDGHDLVIYREADRGSDLAGNALVSLTVRPLPPKTDLVFDEVATDVSLVSKDGTDLSPQPAPNDKDQVSITTDMLAHIGSRGAPSKAPDAVDLVAEVEFKYVQRHVVYGEATYAEYKQVVEFETGRCFLKRTVIVPATEIYLPLYAVASDQGIVYISDMLSDHPSFYDHPLFFTDYQMADRMAGWMFRQKATRIGSRKLSVPILGSKDALSAKPYPTLFATLWQRTPPLPQSTKVPCADPPIISADGEFSR